MTKPALDLKNLTDDEAIQLAGTVASRMGASPDTFPAPSPALTELTHDADNLSDLITERATLQSQITQLTLQIRTARGTLDLGLTEEADYVDKVAKGNPEIIRAAGMRPSADPTPVGEMPKVTGLTATAGDTIGEVDLQWDPVKRGLKSYNIEITIDPAALTGWAYAATSTKSKASITGLTSGTRHWFRVCAIGTAGPGPWSEAATKMAP